MLDCVILWTLHSTLHLLLYLSTGLGADAARGVVRDAVGAGHQCYALQNGRHVGLVTSTKDPSTAAMLLMTFELSKVVPYYGTLNIWRVHVILGALCVSRHVTHEREPPEGLDGNSICLECLKAPRAEDTTKELIFESLMWAN